MAQAKSITIGVEIAGARQTLAAFRNLPKEASTSFRERATDLAASLAGKVAGAARADSPQSALMAPTVKAVKDRIPTITAGGTAQVGQQSRRSSGQGPTQAFMILFGSEFGARSLPQYRPHLGSGSYWMFKTVQANSAQIAAAWNRIADDIVREFARPTPGERVSELAAEQHAEVEAIFDSVHQDFDALGLPDV